MDNIIKGVAKFKKDVFPAHAEKFQELSDGQSPEVLFITCSDSRVDPCLVTQTTPGELFICRNAGNIVPPHSNQTGGMTASIEFAVAGLGIEHIIVCGHTDCGAMKGAINPEGLDKLPHVKEWLGHCRAAAAIVEERRGCIDHGDLDEITKENIKLQLQHLRTHPSVAAKLAAGKVQLHGWLYNIETGDILFHNDANNTFEMLPEEYSNEMSKKPAVTI